MAMEMAPSFTGWWYDQRNADDLYYRKSNNIWDIIFDNGPHLITPSLLDHLKADRLKATFFLLAPNVQWPDIFRRQFAEGHYLASHTWSPKVLTDHDHRSDRGRDLMNREDWPAADGSTAQ
ncbi:hypothetical protein BGZ92_003102, partial [Podila epicladia]